MDVVPTSAAVGSRLGSVASFDEARGIGTVLDDDGATFAFHCTQIAGGTRTIRVGTRVRYALTPGALGEWEAAGLDERA